MSLPSSKHLKHSQARLLEKAAEDVPLQSGHQSFGRGPYCYVKIARDGSSRTFRFRTQEKAHEAMAIGVANDVPLRHTFP